MVLSRTDGNPPPFPHVPDTLRGDSFDPSIPQQSIEPRADTAPYITPYLSLRSRLSQIWINRWTVLLIILLARIIILIAQLRDNLNDAESKALSACTKVEGVGSAMASMPHYLSLGVNELVATGVEKTVHGMVEMLDLVISGVEGIIIFYINFLTATYTCLVTALVHGTLDVVANVTAGATNAYNKLINGTVDDLQKIAKALQKSITNLTTGIEDSVFGNLIAEIPKVNLTKPLDKLKDFQLNSTSFIGGVQQLNKDLPTFEQVQNLTEEAISFPFNILRNALNESYANYEFNRSTFPLAEKQQLTFCSDNDSLNNFFDHLFDLVAKARVVFIVVLSLLAAAVMVPMAWLEIRRWRQQKKHAKLVTQGQRDPMDVVYIASRPFSASYGIRLTSKMNGKQQILYRWCIAYATSPAALFVLSLALSGFLACICQYILLRAVQKETPALAREVGAFAEDVVQSLQNVSQSWADGANGVITGLNDDINHDLLDYVSNATEAVNNTINTFLDKMEEGLETAFNGTILLGPIKTVLHCVIGLKIESVQKGLTWVHDHAHVDLPLFPNNTFSAGANSSLSGDSDLQSFLASPSSVSADEVSGAVDHVTDWLHGNLVQEALVSTGIFLVYVIIVLIGVIQTLIRMSVHERGRAEGGIRYLTQDQMQTNAPAERSWSQDPPPPWAPAASPSAVGGNSSTRGMDNEKFIYGASPTRPNMGSNNPYDRYDEKSGF
ncbi:plasma membrane fusion prm1 [Trichoderma arundinaceum]|uniref:Plasma membrane fusion protein PRM1 n=1 Tax=Trichoderma arundinaceum TaxID=490622 RepID=A0A395NX65_TRIAR|nr:plasma membrane fusion prm1 [Trichoderma arundinaceum]